MLKSLHIENIAVIERADVEFDSGFNALTGETGAGKSILIDSINAVLGERTSKDLIRTGCEKASVSAYFCDISDAAKNKLCELGFEPDESGLSIQRTLTESKSNVRINGIATTASVLRQLAPLLINIHGQHDSQALLNPDLHYVYIDLLADNGDILAEYQAAFSKMQKIRRRLKQLTENAQNSQKRAELLRFQIDELESADIKCGEIERLKTRQNEINNAQAIVDNLTKSAFALYNDYDETPCALFLLDSAVESLENAAQMCKNAQPLSAQLADIRFKADEIREKIESLTEDFEFDADEIEQVESRLDMYYSFSQKYGKNEEEMLGFLDKCKQELKTITSDDEELIKLQNELAPQVKAVKEIGAKLTVSRKRAGEDFSRDVAKQLEFLDMPKVKIIADIKPSPYSHLGADKVELLISTNPGEPPKTLAKIASGGEMSRIMLAIKNVLAAKDPVDTLIFDEIDSGISGSAASKVGDRLYDTARSKQVICVTHLAQIAALADNHLLIKKQIENDRAVTKITKLDFENRRKEIARIIGTKVTDATLKAADELLSRDK